VKKLFTVLLACALVLALGACSQQQMITAESLYRLVEEKSKEMDRISAHVEMEMAMTYEAEEGAETQNVFVSGDVMGENINTEQMRMAMPMTVSMPDIGMTLPTDVYFADGYYLMDMMGQRVKYALPLEQAIEQFKQENIQSIDYVTDLTIMQDSETGLYTLGYKLDTEHALEVTSQYGGGIFSGIANDSENIQWGECTGTIVADAEGNPASQSMEMSFTVTGEEFPIACVMSMTYTYNEIGEDFVVEIPDPASFEEVDAELLGLGE